MKHRKSNVRSKISGDHLENSVRIAITSIETDIDELVMQKQGQNIPLISPSVVFFFFFLSFNKIYKKISLVTYKHKLYYVIHIWPKTNSSSLNASQASQKFGYPWLRGSPKFRWPS